MEARKKKWIKIVFLPKASLNAHISKIYLAKLSHILCITVHYLLISILDYYTHECSDKL